MYTTRELAQPYSTYPTDVTSPGPDQKPGVAKSQPTNPPSDEFRVPQLPDNGDKTPESPENK